MSAATVMNYSPTCTILMEARTLLELWRWWKNAEFWWYPSFSHWKRFFCLIKACRWARRPLTLTIWFISRSNSSSLSPKSAISLWTLSNSMVASWISLKIFRKTSLFQSRKRFFNYLSLKNSRSAPDFRKEKGQSNKLGQKAWKLHEEFTYPENWTDEGA